MEHFLIRQCPVFVSLGIPSVTAFTDISESHYLPGWVRPGAPLKELPISALQCGGSSNSGTGEVKKAGTQHDEHHYPHFIKIKILVKEMMCLNYIYVIANSQSCESNPSLITPISHTTFYQISGFCSTNIDWHCECLLSTTVAEMPL